MLQILPIALAQVNTGNTWKQNGKYIYELWK